MATTITKPAVTLNIIGSQSEVSNTPQKILVFAQKTTGTATAGTLVKDVQLSDVDAVFGTYSIAADVVRNIRKYNGVNSVDVMPYADGTTAATADIQVTAANQTKALTIYVSVGSSVDHRTSVSVGATDDEDTIAASIATAINAMNSGSSKCPFTASATTDTVTITCSQKGKIGNTMSAKLEIPADAGITFDLTPFAGGADSLDLNDPFSKIIDRYQTVIWTFNSDATDVAVITELLEPRLNADKKVLDGVAIASVLGLSDDIATDINSRTLVVLNSAEISDPNTALAMGADQCEKEYAKAAKVAALRALRLTDDASLTRYQTTTAPLDQFGGMGIATLPYFNTLMPDMPKSGANGYTDAQMDTLTAKGYSFIGNNLANSGVVVGDLITTYATDAGGNPDPQWTSLNNLDAMSVAREYFFNNLRKRFAQSRLTGGKAVAGRSIADEDIIAAYCSALNRDLAEVGVTEIGTTTVNGVQIDAEQFFSDNLKIAIDTEAGSVTINAVLLIVGQLRTILGTLTLSFSG